MISDPRDRDDSEPFFKEHWQCPMCPHEINAVTKFGLHALQQLHINSRHKDQNSYCEIHKTNYNLNDYVCCPMCKQDVIPMHSTIAPAVRRDYNILKLTLADFAFLKTRHIKADKDMVLEW